MPVKMELRSDEEWEDAMQNSLILNMLKKGPVTPMDALKHAQCMRLGARIWDLRQMGHQIDREWYETRSGKKVARYYLRKVKKGAA